MYGSGVFGGVPLMILMWFIPVALIIALMVFLTKRPGFGSGKKIDLDIHKERFTRDDIEKEEFDQKRRDIGN